MEGRVETVTISPKFQVVIPKAIRERLGLSPGQRVQALVYGDRIELIPLQPPKRFQVCLHQVSIPYNCVIWCERRDSNPHAFRRQNLNLVRLPIPPLSQLIDCNIIRTLPSASKACNMS